MRQLLFLLLIVIPSFAVGQSAGEILWSVDLAYSSTMSKPAIGPDGTIYVHAGQFYAISPEGTIRWSKPLGVPKAISVSDDGTVYAGSGPPEDDIFVYDPDGNLLWQFAEPAGGQGLMAGPTIGPDGNIYAISDYGGLGAFSLTPQGELRWNVSGFLNNAGTGLTPVPLGLDRLYFAEHTVPGCAVTGMASVDFEGNLDWCAELSGVDLARPMCPPNGNAYITSGNALYAFDPAGDVVWSHNFPIPGGGFTGPGTGPDNAAFVFHSYGDLWAFNSDGSIRWVVDNIAGSNFPVIPTVASDNEALVFGTVYSFGRNGSVFALDPSSGQILWTIPVTGLSEGVSAPAVFSADGNVVYVPHTSVYSTVPSRLVAIQVHAVSQTAPVVSDIPDQSITTTGRFNAIRVDTYVADPDDPDTDIAWSWTGNVALRVSWDPTRRAIKVRAPRNWTGSETITFTATDPDGNSDSDAAMFTVTSAVLERTSAIAEVPSETLLEGNYPNPFNPTTTISYALSRESRVILTVYSTLGEEMITLVDEVQPAGYYSAVWDGRNGKGHPVSSGVYFYRLDAGEYNHAAKMIITK